MTDVSAETCSGQGDADLPDKEGCEQRQVGVKCARIRSAVTLDTFPSWQVLVGCCRG